MLIILNFHFNINDNTSVLEVYVPNSEYRKDKITNIY